MHTSLTKSLLPFFCLFLLWSCNNDKTFIPKPPTYLEIIFPQRNYALYQDSCDIQFIKPEYFKIKASPNECNRDIQFEKLNGTLFLSNITMDTSLATYINYANDKINEHKIKATAIFDTTILRPNDHVYGTFFELQGNVASPFQFYLTDSISNFVSGVVYFNARPNYDSIKPVLEFVKEDLFQLMNTLKWE